MIIHYNKEDGTRVTVRIKEMNQPKPVTLGRGDDASVKIDDAKCSRIHAAIRFWDDIFVIRDMNSHNGTLLNGEQIEVARVRPGDTIKLGDTELHVAEEISSVEATLTL